MLLRRLRLPALAAIAVASMSAAASAHPGHGLATSFAPGFLHPLGGIDHVLAMVAVGLFAAGLGGRALWAVPLSFVAMMAVGGVLGVEQIALPHVETGIAVSVIALGLLVALQLRWPVAAAMALVAVFAVFHGHAHGTEMPLDAAGAAYAAGFVAATALLHAAGIALGIGLQTADHRYWHRTARFSGAAIALAGVLLLTGAL